MLVDKMTHSEIREELIEDFFESILSKRNGLDKKYRHFIIKNKDKDKIAGLHYYFTKRRNNWLVIAFAHKNSLSYGYICIKPSSYGEICYVVNSEELLDKNYLPTNIIIHEFTPHFFDRYKERIDIEIQGKTYEHYFIHNNFGSIYTNEKKGDNYAFIKNTHGYALGYFSLNEKYYKYNTFITEDMLKKNQFSEHPDMQKEHLIIEKFLEMYFNDEIKN